MLLSAGTKTAAPMSLLLCAPSGDLSSVKVFIDHKSSVGTGLLPLCTLCTGNKAPGEHCHKVKQSRGWNTTSATHSTAHTAMKKGGFTFRCTDSVARETRPHADMHRRIRQDMIQSTCQGCTPGAKTDVIMFCSVSLVGVERGVQSIFEPCGPRNFPI